MTTWTGTGGPADVADSVEREGPRFGSLEWRASLALKILAVLNLVGILLATVPAATPSSEFQTVAFHVVSAVLAILFVIVARALDRRRRWAVFAIRPLLIVLLASGLYTFVAAVTAGDIRIPFTALVAGWPLLGSADAKPLPRFSGRGSVVLGLAVVLIALELAGQPLFGWGGLFDVQPEDLTASLTVDCGTPGTGPPERIAISYDWSWSGNTLLPNEEDVVIIGWNGDDADGHPLYVLDDSSDTADGVRFGSSDGPSEAMAQQAADQWRGTLRYAIDLKARGIRPGGVQLVLERAADNTSGPQQLDVGASYIHVNAWRTDAETVTCRW